MSAFKFSPAATFAQRHGLFIALVGGTNSGKTYSSMRLARGIAEAQGKRVAVVDTEGGRTLHLRKEFDFDVTMMDPPHRPERYLDVARDAQEAGYGALLIDSFSNEWRGIGGTLDWMDEELEAHVVRQRAFAEQKGWKFDEHRARNSGKSAASIRPKMAHKLMVSGLLGLRIPIIFAVRGEMTYDPDKKEERFKAQCAPNFLFEVTVSFRLAADKKGIIDLSDAKSWKMEGAHQPIFRDAEQLCERHGELIDAWASGAALPTLEQQAVDQPPADDKTKKVVDDLIAEMDKEGADVDAILARETVRKQVAWMLDKRPEEHKRLFDHANAKRREQKAAA